MNAPESDIMRRIQIAISATGARLFRNNVALAWAGQVQRFPQRTTIVLDPSDIVIRNARPIHAGLIEGSSDLIGWTQTGKFLAVEVKTGTGKTSDAQVNFINAVKSAGGIAYIARSPEDAVKQYEDATHGT